MEGHGLIKIVDARTATPLAAEPTTTETKHTWNKHDTTTICGTYRSNINNSALASTTTTGTVGLEEVLRGRVRRTV